MRHRRHNHRRKNNSKKIIIISVLIIFFTLSIGYAALQTVISINVKGNVVLYADALLKKKVVTSGSGIYKDAYENGRYIFKGDNPDNYICFSNEIQCSTTNLFRIISVEVDGTIKVIRNESIGKFNWDEPGNRDVSTSTYCRGYNDNNIGCNAWSSTVHLIGNPSEFTLYYPNNNPDNYTAIYSGTVITDATLNTYLNTTYYESLSEKVRKLIQKKNWNVSSPGREKNDNEDISIDIIQETGYLWFGNIGLFSVTEVMRTTTDSSCNSLLIGHNNASKSVCSNDNWLWSKGNEWTISPGLIGHCAHVWKTNELGYLNCHDAKNLNNVRPSFYLKNKLKITGLGSLEEPYRVKLNN